jgi:hypothetical protein
MRLSRERQRSLEHVAREAGSLVPRFVVLIAGYAGVVALYCDSRSRCGSWLSAPVAAS